MSLVVFLVILFYMYHHVLAGPIGFGIGGPFGPFPPFGGYGGYGYGSPLTGVAEIIGAIG